LFLETAGEESYFGLDVELASLFSLWRLGFRPAHRRPARAAPIRPGLASPLRDFRSEIERKKKKTGGNVLIWSHRAHGGSGMAGGTRAEVTDSGKPQAKRGVPRADPSLMVRPSHAR